MIKKLKEKKEKIENLKANFKKFKQSTRQRISEEKKLMDQKYQNVPKTIAKMRSRECDKIKEVFQFYLFDQKIQIINLFFPKSGILKDGCNFFFFLFLFFSFFFCDSK